jgi:hypothetical protein
LRSTSSADAVPAVAAGFADSNSPERFVGARPKRLALVDLGGADIVVTPALDIKVTSKVTLDSAALLAADLDDGAVADIILLARAHGAAARAFELAVEYAKVRKQFGRAIGSFQAIQHKLANCHIALEAVGRSVVAGVQKHVALSGDAAFGEPVKVGADDGLGRVERLAVHGAVSAGYAFLRVNHTDDAARGPAALVGCSAQAGRCRSGQPGWPRRRPE